MVLGQRDGPWRSRSNGPEPGDVADGRTDAGAEEPRPGGDRTTAPTPGHRAPAIRHVPTGRTSPFEDD